MTHTLCPACGSVDSSRVVRPLEESYSLRLCAACGTEYAFPRIEADGIWYESFGEFYGGRWEFGQAAADLRMRGGRPHVAEIGCGEGRFLREIGSFCDAVGADLNRAAVARAREAGLNANEGSLHELRSSVSGARFDAVVFFHVLEHMAAPDAFLSEVVEALSGTGWVLGSVPNEARATARLVREFWDRPPHHLTRFSRAGLQRLFARVGLEIVELRDQPLDITPFRLAALAADFNANGESRYPPGTNAVVRKLRKAIPVIRLLAAAREACRNGTGQALYFRAQRNVK